MTRIKLARSFAAALTAFLSVVCAAEKEGEKSMSLLANGGFEEVSVKTGRPLKWRASDWSAPADRKPIKFVAEKGDAPDGETVGRIVSESAGGNLIVQQDVKRPGTGRYVLTLKCKPDEGSIAYASVVGIGGAKNQIYENTKKVSDASQWTALELTCDAPEKTQYLRVLLRANKGASFDDVVLVLVDGAGKILDARKEPSSAKALAKKRDDLSYDLDFDRDRKSKMSEGELAWEKVLEQNLGAFYLPRYKLVKERGGTTAWDFVVDTPDLPRVLLIGDSISRGYTVATRRALAGKVNLHRAPANCGPTATGLKRLDIWLGGGNWDLIHFNFGIHDQRSASEDYASRLEKIVERLQATGAKLVFANSTPLPEDSDNYRHGACAKLNKVAEELMAEHGIPVNDLYGAMLPRLEEFQNPNDCHFNGDGYVFMGDIVAKKILEAFKRGESTP